MKQLFLVLILFPVILFAQKRPTDVIDSGKDVAAINYVQSIPGSITCTRCTKVADIRITDTGDYLRVVIFRHVVTALDSAYRIDDNFIGLTTLPIVILPVESIPFSKAEMVPPPPLPVIKEEIMMSLQTVPIVQLRTENILFSKAEMVAGLPSLPLVQAETVTTLAIVELPVDIPFNKAEIVTTIPRLPDFQLESTLPTRSLVTLPMEYVRFTKAAIVASAPKFELIRTPVEEMHLSPEGYSLLQKLEGYSPELYSLNDGGFTIGFGFFVPYNDAVKWNKGITWEEAERLMQQKVPAYEDQVKQYVNVPLTQNEFDALTMLAYNIGGFSKATSIINDINNQVSFAKLQSDWKRFVHSKAPNVSKGLMNRRKDELEVRELANYQPERKIQIIKYKKQ